MKFSQKTKLFAYEIVSCYAKYDPCQDGYLLSTHDIPDSELQKLAAFIYMDNPDFATESTGPDNYLYDKQMMPALLTYMQNPGSKDARIEFNAIWVEGVTDYAKQTMIFLLEDTLDIYCHDMAA